MGDEKIAFRFSLWPLSMNKHWLNQVGYGNLKIKLKACSIDWKHTFSGHVYVPIFNEGVEAIHVQRRFLARPNIRCQHTHCIIVLLVPARTNPCTIHSQGLNVMKRIILKLSLLYQERQIIESYITYSIILTLNIKCDIFIQLPIYIFSWCQTRAISSKSLHNYTGTSLWAIYLKYDLHRIHVI